MRPYYSLAIALLLIAFTAIGQTDESLVRQTVDKNTIEGHIHFLASDELKGRETGSPEIDIAARYLATTLKRYGVKPVNSDGSYFQNVMLEKTKPATQLNLSLAGKEVLGSDNILSISPGNANVNREMIFLGYGSEDDFKSNDIEGKVVVTQAGAQGKDDVQSQFQLTTSKVEMANEKGAVALIEITPIPDNVWKQVSQFFAGEKFDVAKKEKQRLPHLMLRDADGSLLAHIKSLKGASVKIDIAGAVYEKIISKNVVGMIEGTDPALKDQYIMYSAHYDHIGIGEPNAENDSIYNGARDNAVGVVTVMSAAENIGKYPTKRSALFVLFTGEEKGLLGSGWYAENPLIPLNKVVYCFNSDNASYNDTSVATIVGLERTTASGHIKKACETFGLKALDDPAPEQNLFDRSDNVKFAAKGVPAPTFSLGFTAFDAEVFKYYHKVSDNPDNLDYDYLLKFFQSYVMSCRLIANDEKTPFWVEGDKYYEAGKQLYK